MPRLSIHAVARAYGQNPDDIRKHWRVEDYLDAVEDLSAENQANVDRIKNMQAEKAGKTES